MRIVSLAPSCTEITFALGCGDQLVGRTAFCDYPPETQRIPAVGGWTTANVDAVVALRPDLALTSTFLQVPTVEALKRHGFHVCHPALRASGESGVETLGGALRLPAALHTDPRTLADVLASIDVIAAALNVPERGRELRERMVSTLDILVHASKPPARVYAEEWPNPPMASGNWVPDLIRLAGGISLLPPGERSRTVSLEEVRAFDPDLIVLNYCGMAAVPEEAQVRRVTGRSRWQELRAVRTGRIVVLDDSLLNRPGPRLAQGVQAIASALAKASVCENTDPPHPPGTADSRLRPSGYSGQAG